MSAVLIAIALTTGACAFMFFVLPAMDARKAKQTPASASEDEPAESPG